MGIKYTVKKQLQRGGRYLLIAVLVFASILSPSMLSTTTASAVTVLDPSDAESTPNDTDVGEVKDCDYNFYSSNDIVTYDPCAAVCAPSGSGEISIEDSKETAEAVFKFLISAPLSSNNNQPMNAVQAAGVLGNMQAESGVDSTTIQSGKEYDESMAMSGAGGYAFGLVQWDGGRRVELLKYAKSRGKEWSDLETQMNFLKKELEGTEKKIMSDSEFKSTSDPAQAAVRFRVVFERAGVPHDETRQKAANAFYKEFKDLAPGEVAFGSGGRCAMAAGNGDITATAILLSYPKRLPNGSIKPKPEYQQALEATGVNKLGDKCSMGGYSCDAFVATVMRYSGADTEFPCCGANRLGQYMNSHPDKYQALGHITSTKTLQAGDIMWRDGHIKIYIGDGKQADASHCQRTASISDQTYFDGFYYAFRSTSTAKGGVGKAASAV